jgi:hypothetical protein
MHFDTDEKLAVDMRTAAKVLGGSKSHLDKLRIDVPENSPPCFRIGKCVRYSVERLKEWFKAG